MTQLRRLVSLLATSLALASSAQAGTFSLDSGPGSTLTFVSVSGARTVVSAPTVCFGTVTPSWPTGSFSAATCDDEATSVTADGRLATAHLSASSATGSFGARNVLHFRPTFTIRVVANDGAFDCTATTTSTGLPDFSAVMSPTLPLPPPQYVGNLALVSSVATGHFGATSSCSASVARGLDAQFTSLSFGAFDTSYAP